jgi:hypothetical protein
VKIAGRTGRKAGDDLVFGLRFHFLLSVLSDNLYENKVGTSARMNSF